MAQSPAGGTQPPSQGQSDGQQAGPISQLMDQVGGALQHLDQVFASSKSIDPKEQQLMSQIVQMYGALMGSIGGQSDQGDQSGQPGAQGQTSPIEAAGNPGAQPVQ